MKTVNVLLAGLLLGGLAVWGAGSALAGGGPIRRRLRCRS